MEFIDFYTKSLNEIEELPPKEQDDGILPVMDRDEDHQEEEEKEVPEEDDEEEREEEKREELKQKLTPQDYSKARDKLVTKFNEENEDNTDIRLAEYTPNEDIPNAFMVIADIDKEEVYLDREKYKDGLAPIVLSQVFYNDVLATAKEIGIVDILWQDNGRLGQVLLLAPTK